MASRTRQVDFLHVIDFIETRGNNADEFSWFPILPGRTGDAVWRDGVTDQIEAVPAVRTEQQPAAGREIAHQQGHPPEVILRVVRADGQQGRVPANRPDAPARASNSAPSMSILIYVGRSAASTSSSGRQST